MMITLKKFIKNQTKNIEDWGSFHDYFSDDDHICTPDPPQEETIIEVYNETYEEIHEVCNMYDDTPPCSPLRDEVLECFTTCNTFETKLLRMIIVNMRRLFISGNVIPLMKTLS